MKKLTLIIRPDTANKILKSIPANCSISIKAGDANRILDAKTNIKGK